MPGQEIFWQQEARGGRIEVVKSYDKQYAQEAFSVMTNEALTHLWAQLEPETMYDQNDLPKADASQDIRAEFLWDELIEASRESDNLFSFFIVNRLADGRTRSLYVSPDWPSAASFAESLLTHAI